LYQQYFNFSELPFSIAPDPHFIYMSERHQEGLAHLLYGITMGGGFVALTGEVGTGKTTLCRCLVQQLPANIDIALILNPKLNAIELLSTLCDELSIVYNKTDRTLKNLIDNITQYLLSAFAEGRGTVLLIDEAQNLSLEVLEQIRLLTNLETTKAKLLQIILVGQPELKQLLQRKDLRQLNQRITSRYHLLPLSLAETRTYIQHRLSISNGNTDLFKDAAIRSIYRYSSGIPRLINILCDRALLGAYASNVRSITPKIIRNAAQEALDLNREPVHSSSGLALLFWVAIAACIYLFSQQPQLYDQAIQVIALPAAQQSVNQTLPEPESQILPKPVVSETNVKPFDVWLDDSGLTLNAAMAEMLKIWKKNQAPDNTSDCKYTASIGLHCLLDKASWGELLALDRPAILEFTLSSGLKRYALLIGVNNGQPVIRFNDDITFPLNEVLDLWKGYYLILWQSPIPGMINIIPEQVSGNVLWLRKQLSSVTGVSTAAKQPLLYDKPLKEQVIAFQRRHTITADGIAGARTLIHLDNETGAYGSPHLKITD
jgi:general secretion pathway protein A